MKIAYIGLRGVPAAYSGVEVAVEEIGSRLANRGHKVTVYCMADGGNVRPTQHGGMTLRHMPCLKGMNTRMITYAIISTLDAMFRDYDVVHFHALGPATLALVPKLFGKKTVVTVHGLDWARGKWGTLARTYLKCGEWASARLPDETVVVSECLKEHYARRFKRESVYIPNGVPINAKQELGSIGAEFGLIPGEYLLFVGRLTPEKNVHQLIEAYGSVSGNRKLVVVGGSATHSGYQAHLEALATRDPRVVLTGPIYGDVVKKLLSNAFLFVLPSAVEGLPISLLEALSFGLPSLVSDIPENCEVLRWNGKFGGFTFSAGNLDSLVGQLNRLCIEPAVARSVSNLAIAIARHKYNWDAVASDLQRLYEKMLTGEIPTESELHLPTSLTSGVE